MASLDEKLQFGLLEYLKKAKTYHFEEDVLFLQPGSPEDEKYFAKSAVTQQLLILAQDAVGVKEVRFTKAESQ